MFEIEGFLMVVISSRQVTVLASGTYLLLYFVCIMNLSRCFEYRYVYLNALGMVHQMTFQRLILISISPMMLFCLPNTKHCLILLQLIPGMYKSIFRILTIVEVISNLCFLALFSSMQAWNNGKALDSESEDPGSIPAKGKFFF